MKKLIPFVIFLAILSCDHQTETGHKKTDHKVFPQKRVKATIPLSEKVIHILPLGVVPTQYIREIKSAVKRFYGYDCIVLSQVKPTDDIMAQSKTRYEAGKILEKYETSDYRIIITEEDIAFPNKKRNSQEWGIFGLGYYPGTICVVSTFRLKRHVSHEVFLERLKKVALHEIGHNLGLDHCTNNPQCMMNAANGSIKEVDLEREWLCEKCRSLLKMN